MLAFFSLLPILYMGKDVKTAIKISGKLVIEKIDRRNGKLVERKEIKNVLTENGAYHISVYAYDPSQIFCDQGIEGLKVNKLVLLDSSRNLIKAIPDGVRGSQYSGNTIVITLTWRDDTADEYTVYYAGIAIAVKSLSSPVNMDLDLIHAAAVSSPFTKGPEDTVKYTWTINIPFGRI